MEYEVFEPDDRDVKEFGREALKAAFDKWCQCACYEEGYQSTTL